MKTYRTGIVGAGFGVKAHLPALAAHPRFEIVALASPATAAKVAKERNIPHAFTSCAEMLAGVELDAVVVAGPPFTHHGDVIASLDARKHVLCEKPFALSVAQTEEMLRAAQRAGTACGVVHEFRFVPQRQALRELVANGHLAPLRDVEITQLATFLRATGDRPRGWWFERERGGGIAGAWVSHMVDSVTWTLGRTPVRASGYLRTANPKRRDADGEFSSTVDDGVFAIVDYGEGCIARVTADATTAVEAFTFAVHAENRTAVASGPSIAEMTLFSIDDDETNELGCSPLRYAKFESISPNVPLLMELYDEWVAQIETGQSALPTFAEAVETQRVLAAIGYGPSTGSG